jgi:methyl-accepting chemotaxis protein
MSKRPQQSESSELVNAAQSIEEELRKFEVLAEEVRTGALRSQKHLEKMGKLLTSVADCDERMVASMRTLLGVLNKWRDRQQTLAAEVNSRAQELQQRTQVYQDLMLRFSELGQEAGGLSSQMQQVAGMTQQGQAASAEEIISSLQQVNEKMTQVADNAGKLASDAEAQDFLDVSRDAESLRQQLLSARNRANLLQQKLHPANA